MSCVVLHFLSLSFSRLFPFHLLIVLINVCLSVCALPPQSHYVLCSQCSLCSSYYSCSSCSSHSWCFHVPCIPHAPCVPCISSIHCVPAYVPSPSLVCILPFFLISFIFLFFHCLPFWFWGLHCQLFVDCLLYLHFVFFCFYWTLHHRFILIKLALFSPACLWVSCVWVPLWYSCIHYLRVTNTIIIVKDEFDW